ncbi:TPA: translocation/assembly module TamB domain-containing protein [Legionella pneumophila]
MMILKFIKKGFYYCLITAICLVSLIIFLISTTPGLYAVIKLTHLYLPGTLKIHHLKGQLLDQFSIGEMEYQHQDTKIKIFNLAVNWRFSSLLRKKLPIDSLSAEKIEINQKTPILILKNIKLSGYLNQQLIKLNTLQFNYWNQLITSQLEVSNSFPHAFSGKIRLNPHSTNKNIFSGGVDIGGNRNQTQWGGEFEGPGKITINGSLQQLKQIKQIIKWRDLHWQDNKNHNLKSSQGRIEVSGTIPNLAIDLKSKLGIDQLKNWQMNASIKGKLPWQWSVNATFSQPLDFSSKLDGLYTKFALKMETQSDHHANFLITIAPGHYQMTENNLMPLIQFTGGNIKGSLSPKQFSGQGVLFLDAYKKVNFNFKFPEFNVYQDIAQQTIDAKLSILFNSLDFLQNVSPYFMNPKGQLLASIHAKGTLNKPRIESKLTLNKGSVNIPTLGLNITDMGLAVFSKKDGWEATGSIHSSEKKLTLKGQGSFNKELGGTVSIEGSNFPVANTKEFQVNISPQLNVRFTPSLCQITGTIQIPNAHIKPQTFTNSLVATDDIVFTSKNTQPITPLFNTNMSVRVEMGEEVELTFKGLHAYLAGIVTINQLSQGPITANGELAVKKGEYKAYGQDLSIEQGQLIFTGGRIDNPEINLRASKNISNSFGSVSGSSELFNFNNYNNLNVGNNFNVGVEVAGRLQSPKIQLFSNPPTLSQADILSFLVIGRPANQADKAKGQLLLTAISSMNLGTGTNGTQLLEQLKQKLGFDFNVQTTTNFNQQTNKISESTGVVVGKSLSDRIYLSYNVGLSQTDPNVLTLKYILNKFLSIQVSSSDSGNGVDVLYTKSSSSPKKTKPDK